jgi:5-methylcytosine-specific restriction protein A
MVRLYSTLIEGETGSTAANATEGDEPPDMDFEDATKLRLHKRIERNASLSKKVKKLQGDVCKVCGIKFEDIYGSIGKGYIEAHHLRPLASLKGQKVPMDPDKDFAVLCSNCHRMVHRSGCVDNIQKFKKDYFCG